MLMGDRPPVTLPHTVGEIRPKVGIYCPAPFEGTQLACFQGSEVARRNVRDYLRSMALLAVASMEQHGTASAGSPATAVASETASSEMTLVGVVLQLQDPLTSVSGDLHVPWEFHRIASLDDEGELDAAVAALASLRLSGGDSGCSAATSAGAARAAAAADDRAQADDDDDGPVVRVNPHRLSLYTRHVTRFTGIYPACVICVKGTASKRDRHGRVTAIIAKQIFTPRRPTFPWETPAAPLNLGLSMKASIADRQGARVQFLSGPFPRNELPRLASAIVKQAAVRGVNVVIIAGPLVPPYKPEEHHYFVRNQLTFPDQLDQFVDALEEEIAAHRNHSTRFVLVPSVEDAVCFPIVPQPCLAISVGDVVQEMPGDDEDDRLAGAERPQGGTIRTVEAKGLIQVASNPCEVLVRTGYPCNATDTDEERRGLATGVRFGVTSFDSMSLMRDEMVERYPDGDGNSLHRVAETVLASRLYVPLVSCPSPNHDLAHLPKVLLERDASASESFGELRGGKVYEAADADGGLSASKPTGVATAPHVVFLPSIRPPFAVVSHTGRQDLSDPRGRGALIINQGAWNNRQSGIPFSLKIVEVTMTSLRAVALGGASSENGVTVGTIEIYDSD